MNTIPPETQSPNLVINSLQSQIQRFLSNTKEETGVPGICLALSVGKQMVTSSVGTLSIDSSDPMSEGTHFQLGCISKLLTAMVAAELIEAGKFDPDDPIEKYLEELRGTDRGKKLAIWHLLSHTSGYRGLNINDIKVAYHYSWPDFLKFFNTTPQLFEPGSVFSYEHSEYAILGEIIKRISGRDIVDLYNEMIFEPLKITAGSIKSAQRGNEPYAIDHVFNPDTMTFSKLSPLAFADFWDASLSSITINMKDLLRIASTICGITKAPSGISEKALKFVQKQVVKLPYTYGSARHEQIPGAFGVGCGLYRGWLLGHNGSARGQTCGLRFDPRINIALVIGINAWQPFFRDSIIDHIFSMVRGEPIPPFPKEPLQSALNELVGTYIGPNGFDIIVSNKGEQITCTLRNLNSPPHAIILKKDENGVLRACSDTQHYSIGFFHEPDSGVAALMLGMSAFRKH